MNIKKVLLVIISPIIIIAIILPGIITNTFLYYINDSSLILDKYKIEFPLGHWAYFKENKLTHTLSGRRVDGKTLRIEVFKQVNTINLNKLIPKCDTSEKSIKSYAHISGIQYVCHYDKKSMMYFISTDKNLVLSSGDNFSSENEKELQSYELLFNNIAPRLYNQNPLK